jgi:hypothetical protein
MAPQKKKQQQRRRLSPQQEMEAPKKTSNKKRAAGNQIAAESRRSRRIQGISPAAEHLMGGGLEINNLNNDGNGVASLNPDENHENDDEEEGDIARAPLQCRNKEKYVNGVSMDRAVWSSAYAHLAATGRPQMPKGARKTGSGAPEAFAALGALTVSAGKVPSGNQSKDHKDYKHLPLQEAFVAITGRADLSIFSCPQEGNWLKNQETAAKNGIWFTANDHRMCNIHGCPGLFLWAPIYVALLRVGIELPDPIFQDEAQEYVSSQINTRGQRRARGRRGGGGTRRGQGRGRGGGLVGRRQRH